MIGTGCEEKLLEERKRLRDSVHLASLNGLVRFAQNTDDCCSCFPDFVEKEIIDMLRKWLTEKKRDVMGKTKSIFSFSVNYVETKSSILPESIQKRQTIYLTFSVAWMKVRRSRVLHPIYMCCIVIGIF